MVEFDSTDRERTLLFRNYLRKYPEVAQAYASLKNKLADQYKHNRPRYVKEKAPFIEQVLAQARKECPSYRNFRFNLSECQS